MCAKKVDIKNGAKKQKGSALSKYIKIDAMQRNMFIAVCGASIALSLTIVGILRLSSYISFNTKVITEKDKVIKGYTQIQKDLVVLRGQVAGLVKDKNLESVARFRGDECYDNANKEVDNEQYSLNDIELARTCSALRVVPDALPSKENMLSTLTNMNQLLNWSNYKAGVKFDGLSGSDGGTSSNTGSTTSSIHAVTVSLSLSDSGKNVQGALKEIEDSVRNFDINSAQLSWNSDEYWTGREFDESELEFSGSFTAYYSDTVELETQSRTVCANKKSEKCRSAGGDSVGDQYGQVAGGASSSSSSMYDDMGMDEGDEE